MFKVFYSWQSNLAPRANRYLIQNSLDNACRALRSANGVIAESVVERDTLGLPGAPSITEAILSKIRDSDAFVADVSLIPALHSKAEGRVSRLKQRLGHRLMQGTPHAVAVPNPNVLTELGYAMSQLGNEALVLVANTFYGPIESLPFDLRSLRLMTYRADPEEELADIRKALQKDFERAIGSIAATVRGDPVDSILYERTRQVAGQAFGIFAELSRTANTIDPSITEEQLGILFDQVSEQQCAIICGRVDPNSPAPLLIAAGTSSQRNATWLEYMLHWRHRSLSFTQQILVFSQFLKREHVALLMHVEQCSYFSQVQAIAGQPIRNADLEWIAGSLWKYIRHAIALKQYAERELARRARLF